MRRRAIAVGSAVVVACVAHAPALVEPGLPEWNEEQRAALVEGGWSAGGLLLTDDAMAAEPAREAGEEKALDMEQPTAEEIAESELPPNEIPEEFWPDYFGRRPDTFLVDPQGLLSPTDYRDRIEFLNDHAGDSSTDLFVYVFRGDQEIPGEVREEELVERFFSEGRPAAVVYYYLGAPQRSVIYLSPALTDAVSAAEQRRALESSVMQAFEKTEPAGQIEAFLVQMSIRIYWMERMLGGAGADGDTMISAPPANQENEKKPGAMERFAPYVETAKRYGILALVVFGSLACGLGVSAWMRLKAQFCFPEFDVEPRLGGAHAAGVGAVISFASASVPPASQRDQVPDYLRRM